MFPERLEIPETVLKTRQMRSKALVRIAFAGIIIRLFIGFFELAGFFYFHSSALLLDALFTFIDATSSILLIASIKLAARPPDENHPFGHGRYEPLAGLQLGVFLALGGLFTFGQQLMSLFQTTPYSIDARCWIFPFIAVILLEVAYFKIKKIALREKSVALTSEAFHFRIDSLNSVIALIALLSSVFIPGISFYLDKGGAIVIALFMVIIGLYAARSNLHQLMDRTPSREYFDLVRSSALQVDGVMETEKILIQIYGPDAHVAIDVEVDPYLSVEKAHKISQWVRNSIQKNWPQVREVVVHIEPYYENDHVKFQKPT